MKTLKMMTDEELVVLYAEGNNAAFDILLNRYKSSIHSYIYFIVRNKELTDRKSTRLNSSHKHRSRMPSSA